MKRFAVTDEIPDDLSELAEPLLTLEEQIETVVFELTKEIEVNGVPTKELELNAPSALALSLASKIKKDDDRLFATMSKYVECKPSDLHPLHARDLRRLTNLMDAFMV